MRAIGRDTYKMFMKKYKLRLSKKVNGRYKQKTLKQMQKEIYDYESNLDNELKEDGLYFYL